MYVISGAKPALPRSTIVQVVATKIVRARTVSIQAGMQRNSNSPLTIAPIADTPIASFEGGEADDTYDSPRACIAARRRLRRRIRTVQSAATIATTISQVTVRGVWGDSSAPTITGSPGAIRKVAEALNPAGSRGFS